VQHEFDHLQGTLFIDRMSTKVRTEVQKEIDAIQAATKAALKK
jgi:peptide deformylase